VHCPFRSCFLARKAVCMIVLGIETTCDETAVSVVENGERILSNVIASQLDIHQKYNGVFPELASRRHIEILLPLVDEALKKAGVSKKEINLIAAAHGPGLIGAILIGLNTAKSLALAWDIPFVGVNHVEAHLYAAMMNRLKTLPEKALGVVLSGGHTFLTQISGIGNYTLIGTTVDDAMGEAFDKVASLLELPYPGGPFIEKLAREGDSARFPFSAGRVKTSPFHFSFSGLKTSVLYEVKGQGKKKREEPITAQDKKDIAASFQQTAIDDVVKKTLLAASTYGCGAIYLGGGVSQNQALRDAFTKKTADLPVYWPEKDLCTDNAAMIAGLGFHKYKQHGAASFNLEAMPRIPF
jgi:N6-L-threonylcarbamoyladenine synthase